MRKITNPTDLTDAQCQHLQSRLLARSKRVRPATVYRTVVNAILYLLRTGCAWRVLPAYFGSWRTAYGWFNQWSADSTWQRLQYRLCRTLGKCHNPSPPFWTAVGKSRQTRLRGRL